MERVYTMNFDRAKRNTFIAIKNIHLLKFILLRMLYCTCIINEMSLETNIRLRVLLVP